MAGAARRARPKDLTRYLDVNPLHASLNVKLVQADAYAAVVSELRSREWEGVVALVKEQQALATNLVTVTNVLGRRARSSSW